MSVYPGDIDDFTRKVDNQDTILANDVNELQVAIEHVETELGKDPAGTFTDVVSRLDDMDDQIADMTIQDTNVNLSDGNVGSHSTLEEHVKDVTIHSDLDALAYNYQQMMEKTLDQILRGVLTSGYPLNSADTNTTSSFPMDSGDVAFCFPASNPSSSGYNWFMVTGSSSSLASTGSLRLNDEAVAPVFSDSSRITKLQPLDVYIEGDMAEVEFEEGNLVFAHPEAYPSTSSYSWFMATADASTGSEIRLNDETSTPVFADDSHVSVFEQTYSEVANPSSTMMKQGDLVFCYPTANPAGTGYGWHIVTYASGSVFYLDGESSSPTFATGSTLSKYIVTQTAACDDASMPIRQGDLVYCYSIPRKSVMKSCS